MSRRSNPHLFGAVLRALLLDPVDLRGLPFLGPDGRSKWATPDFLPTEGEGILFLDELNAAPAMVQASCYQLVLDRKLGEYTLPDGWAIVAAGNRDSDRAVTTRMPTPLRNLSAFDRDANAFPSPRSWEFVSGILAEGPNRRLEQELYVGAVGLGAATEFGAFLKTFRELPSIEGILMDPAREPVPDQPDAQYAVATALANSASDTNFDRMCVYLQRMPTEFQVFCVRDASLRDPSIRSTKGYVTWAVENHHAIA